MADQHIFDCEFERLHHPSQVFSILRTDATCETRIFHERKSTSYDTCLICCSGTIKDKGTPNIMILTNLSRHQACATFDEATCEGSSTKITISTVICISMRTRHPITVRRRLNRVEKTQRRPARRLARGQLKLRHARVGRFE